MMGGCHKCTHACGWMFLILGVLFLLQDLGIWMFFGINWWTALFVVYGFSCIAKSKCKACMKSR